MRKLRIGIWLLDNYRPEEGGGFGYYSQMIKGLKTYDFKDAEIIFISNKINTAFFSDQRTYEIKVKKVFPPKLSFAKKVLRKAGTKLGLNLFNIDYTKIDKHYADDLKNELNQVIDIVYYLTPQVVIPNFPYIYTLWDIGHLSMYAFPEVSMNDTFENRKKEHDLSPQKALMVFCESEAGKQEAVKFLNINANRIKVVPLFPSEIVNETIVPQQPKKVKSKIEFIHYPAQYWAHKNHYNLLVAFKVVLKMHPDLKLLFTGSDKGNKSYILSVIEELDLENVVLDLGFVTIQELKWIYLNSFGLVMPTFLGPTNMPVLEAAGLGCPVACSDFAGHKEQLRDYAYYFDPLSPNNIAMAIEKMILDKINNETRSYSNISTIENAMESIETAFSEIKQIRFCWGNFDQIF
jgi:glycosyltransferase involved in cell wall biosynthesis